MIRFGTKAETLERLRGRLRSAEVLPQVRFTASEWKRGTDKQLERLKREPWAKSALIVRSSARLEDSAGGSMAGHFASVGGVRGEASLRKAVAEVIGSFNGRSSAKDQIFVQPMLEGVKLGGVALSLDPNAGAPYVVINYDKTSRSTSTITRGDAADARTAYVYRHGPKRPDGDLGRVVALVTELEKIFKTDALDVEFAVGKDGALYLLQVRPLVVRGKRTDAKGHRAAVDGIRGKLADLGRPHPYLHGRRSLFGVMPDWNPAEMIGVRPHPLALSLYKEIITDNIWAYQRDNYGYRNLRSFPLMVSLGGLPYIDVRVDFNSFIPKDVEPELTERLVNLYLDRLEKTPSHHDKVEFEIVFSCFTLDLPERLESLGAHGFSSAERRGLAHSLKALTDRVINGQTGLWRGDLERIRHLELAYEKILTSELDPVGKIYWLLEDLKRYGTLPFAGLARAAFIAVQLLKSMEKVGVLSRADVDAFLRSLDTVAARMGRDARELSRAAFLETYGHLRPGTYDILSPRYDEAPELYFDWSSKKKAPSKKKPDFTLTREQERSLESLLKERGLDSSVHGLFDFIKQAIEGREHAKFVFTRSLSEVLRQFGALGETHGLSLEDCAHADIGVIRALYASSGDAGDALRASIAEGRRSHALTQKLVLPPLISSPDDVWSFELPASEPNYVTMKRARGAVAFTTQPRSKLKDAILLIPNADPGYDWIFSHPIAGLVTMFGGANSHMAVRAGELGIPAVIGAGETLYNRWAAARILELDAANRQVHVLR
jgi:glutamine kinase